MRDDIRRRVVDISQYIVDTKATVRQAAAVFGVSKSTVHKDGPKLAAGQQGFGCRVKRILSGIKLNDTFGVATKRKYSRNRKASDGRPERTGPYAMLYNGADLQGSIPHRRKFALHL